LDLSVSDGCKVRCGADRRFVLRNLLSERQLNKNEHLQQAVMIIPNIGVSLGYQQTPGTVRYSERTQVHE
jgi:hypothetical protein